MGLRTSAGTMLENAVAEPVVVPAPVPLPVPPEPEPEKVPDTAPVETAAPAKLPDTVAGLVSEAPLNPVPENDAVIEPEEAIASFTPFAVKTLSAPPTTFAD